VLFVGSYIFRYAYNEIKEEKLWSIVGIVGAMLGGWLAGAFGLYTGSSIGAFLPALAGAVLLVGLTRFIERRV
jgi:uncharacterized membrane protein YeaQ/YmgE (transglycosylase-associated protein family)